MFSTGDIRNPINIQKIIIAEMRAERSDPSHSFFSTMVMYKPQVFTVKVMISWQRPTTDAEPQDDLLCRKIEEGTFSR